MFTVPPVFAFLIGLVETWVVPLAMGWCEFRWFAADSGNRRVRQITDRAFLAGLCLAVLLLFLLTHFFFGDTKSIVEPPTWSVMVWSVTGFLSGIVIAWLKLPNGKKWVSELTARGVWTWGVTVFLATGFGLASLAVYHPGSAYLWVCRLLQFGSLAVVLGYRLTLLIGDIR